MTEKKTTDKQAEKTVAETTWEKIKDLDLVMFSIPNQPVSKYCKPITVEPNKLYLMVSVSSVVPALEELLKGTFEVEQVDKYLAVFPK